MRLGAYEDLAIFSTRALISSASQTRGLACAAFIVLGRMASASTLPVGLSWKGHFPAHFCLESIASSSPTRLMRSAQSDDGIRSSISASCPFGHLSGQEA